MRGIPSLITDIRKQVFTEVARMAYSGDYTQMEDIPSTSCRGKAHCTGNPYFWSGPSRASACGWQWDCRSSPCSSGRC